MKKIISYLKLLSLKKLLYLPYSFSKTEKRWVFLALIVGVVAGGALAVRIYLRTTVPRPAVGGTYTEGLLKEPHAINPVLASNDTDRSIARLIFSRLITYTADGKIEYDLAQSLEISDDGKVYTVKLKDGIKWHDGETLNANDVLFTVKMVQNPQFKSVLRANWQGVSAEKIDENTIKFILRAPYAPFIENLTLGILPRHLWETIGPEKAPLHELNLKPVGSGPYRFHKFKQSRDGSLISYELKRNLNYYREGPYLKNITFRFFKNEDEAQIALRRREIDGLGGITRRAYDGIDKNNFSLYTFQTSRIFGIFFNERRSPILADTKVRLAIAHSLDKKALSGMVEGGASISDYPIPISKKSEETYTYDPEKSRSLLKEAGWMDENDDGIREKLIKESGKNTVIPLRLTLSTSDWPDLVRTAEAIVSMFRESGIDVKLDIRPFAELETDVIRQRNFEMLLFGHVYGYEIDPFAFWHSSQIKDPGLNIALYASKKADELLEQARRISDPAERTAKYVELSSLLLKDLPAIFLYSQLYLYIIPADIKGMKITKISLPADRFNDVNRWYRNTKRVLKK